MTQSTDSAPNEHELLRKIATLRKQREALLAQVKVLTIQLESYEDAATMFFGREQFDAFMSALGGSDIPSLPSVYGVASEAGDGKRKRSISANWATLLKSLHSMTSFGYSEIVSMSELRNLGITIAAARSQMKTYVSSGYVDRINDGEFTVTNKGLAAAEEALRKVQPNQPLTGAAWDRALAAASRNMAPDLSNVVPPPPPGSLPRVEDWEILEFPAVEAPTYYVEPLPMPTMPEWERPDITAAEAFAQPPAAPDDFSQWFQEDSGKKA